ncbi:nucleoid occlusion factor SlmA, partial [Burkholderia pseudomallei]
RVLTGVALVGEHERLAERVNQMLVRVEASIKQCLRVALLEAQAHAAGGGAPPPVPQPDDYDTALRASLVISYVLGRW